MFIVLEASLILCDYKLNVFYQNLKTCPVPSFSIYHHTMLFFLPLFPPVEYKLCKDKSLSVRHQQYLTLHWNRGYSIEIDEESSQWIHVMLWDN